MLAREGMRTENDAGDDGGGEQRTDRLAECAEVARLLARALSPDVTFTLWAGSRRLGKCSLQGLFQPE